MVSTQKAATERQIVGPVSKQAVSTLVSTTAAATERLVIEAIAVRIAQARGVRCGSAGRHFRRWHDHPAERTTAGARVQSADPMEG